MSGRPPLKGAPVTDDQEYDEEYNEEQAYDEEADGDNNNNADEENQQPASDDDSFSRPQTGEVQQYVPPPEEKQLPPSYVIDIGAISQDAENATRNLFVPSEDIRIPKWLNYILNDDFPSLSYLVHPPPGAEITFPDANNNKDNKGDVDGDGRGGDSDYGSSEYDRQSDRSGGSRPTSSRGGDSDGAGLGGNLPTETPFHPNERFTLTPDPEHPNQKWHLSAYEPPVSKKKSRRPGSAGGMSDDLGSQVSGRGGGESGANSEMGAGDGDGSPSEIGGTSALGDEEVEPEEVKYVVDALTLAAMLSPEALAMCLRERRVPLPDPDAPPKSAEDDDMMVDDGYGGEDEQQAPTKAAPELNLIWKWCEAFGGLDNMWDNSQNGCQPLYALIKALTAFQQEAEPEPQPKKTNKKKQQLDEDGDDEYADGGAAADEADDEYLESDESAKQTLKQRRRFFFDFNRIFELIVKETESSLNSQRHEKTMITLMTDCNVAPSSPIDLKRLALHSVPTLHAYASFMMHVPRSLVAPWTEAIPLTEEEINSYPEGADVPDEHPARVPPQLWKIAQQIRRRAAKQERAGAAEEQPRRRPLKEVFVKFFTPAVDDMMGADEGVKPQPTVYTPDDDPAGVDPCLTSTFNKFAGFGGTCTYPPTSVRVHLSDIVCVMTAMQEFDGAADALEFIASMQRTFPHPKWHPTGSAQILALSLGRMSPACALVTVSKLLDPDWFLPASRVSTSTFVSEVMMVPKSYFPLNKHNIFYTDEKVIAAFAENFCGIFLGIARWRDGMLESARAGDIGDSVPNLVTRFKAILQCHAAATEAIEQNKLNEADMIHELNTNSDGCLPLIATPKMLALALASSNKVAALWLVEHGVRCVEVENRLEQPVLEHLIGGAKSQPTQIQQKCADMLIHLVSRYGDLHASVAGGKVTLLAMAQKSFHPDVVPKIEKAFEVANAKRAADPKCYLGV